MGVAFAAGSSPVTYTPKFAYVTNGCCGRPVRGTRSTPRAARSRPSPHRPFPPDSNPISAAVDPTGRFAYVANSDAMMCPGIPDRRHHRRADAHHRITLRRRTRSAIRGGGPFGQIRLCGELPGQHRFGVHDQLDQRRANAYPRVAVPRKPSRLRGRGPHRQVRLCDEPCRRHRFGVHHQRHHRRAHAYSRIALRRTPPCSPALLRCSELRSSGPHRQVRLRGESSAVQHRLRGTRSTPPPVRSTPIAGSPFAAGATATSVAVDPSGEFAYVATSCWRFGVHDQRHHRRAHAYPGIALRRRRPATRMHNPWRWTPRASSPMRCICGTIDLQRWRCVRGHDQRHHRRAHAHPRLARFQPAPRWSTSIAVSGEIH